MQKLIKPARPLDPPIKPQEDIVQEEVMDVWLYRDRFKTTIRAYLVAWDGRLFLSKYAEGIVCRGHCACFSEL